MAPKDPEDLLWELSRLGEVDTEEPLDDEALRAWREGRMSEEEAAALEKRLADSPASRARLRELAGLAGGGLSPELRERVLARFGERERQNVVDFQRPEPRKPLRWRSRWLPAAALAASVLVAVLVFRTPDPLPPGLAYDLTAQGLALERSGAPGAPSGTVEAYPDTSVRLDVTPQGAAEGDVEVGLYRRRGGRLERLEPGAEISVERARGAFRVQGRAGALVGGEPGLRELFIVVARTGDLPDGLEPGDGPRHEPAGERRRLIYIQPIRILAR